MHQTHVKVMQKKYKKKNPAHNTNEYLWEMDT